MDTNKNIDKLQKCKQLVKLKNNKKNANRQNMNK